MRQLRPRLRAAWLSDKDGVVVIANGLLSEFHALPQLVKHDEWDYHLHATPSEAPLAARMGVEAAMASSTWSARTNSAGSGSAGTSIAAMSWSTCRATDPSGTAT